MSSPRTFAGWCLVMAASSAIVALAYGQPAATQPATQPASPSALPPAVPPVAPTSAELPALVDALADREPAVRGRAREALMLLGRDALPALRDAARSRLPLKATQRSLLRDVVVQVFLAAKHRFAGEGPGYVGVSSRAFGQETAFVYSCTPGWDGYRVLQPSDVIVGVKRLTGEHVDPARAMTPVTTFLQLRAILDLIPVGEWIRVRLIRNGAEQTVDLRLGPRPEPEPTSDLAVIVQQNGNVVVNNGPVNNGLVNNGVANVEAADQTDAPPTGYAEGEAYWTQTFEPALAPATQPN